MFRKYLMLICLSLTDLPRDQQEMLEIKVFTIHMRQIVVFDD